MLMAWLPKLVALSVLGGAVSMVSGCTFTYARDTVPPTSPAIFPLGSLPATLPTISTSTTAAANTAASTTAAPTTTTSPAPTTSATTAAPTTTTGATTTVTVPKTGATVAAKPPYEYDGPAVALPLVIDDALVARVKELGWEVDDQQDGAFQGSPEVAYFADTPNPEASPWLKIRTDWNARGVCDVFGVPAEDPCEDAAIKFKGRWTLHSERLNTGVRVVNNVSEKLGEDVMHTSTWGADLIPKVDESLLPPEMNTHELWYVGAGLIANADAKGAPVATLRLKTPRSSGIDLLISTLGVNMPLRPYRLDLDSDATIKSVKVNGNDAMLTESDGDLKLIWNTDDGLKYVNSFRDQRAGAFLRSLIDS